MALVVPIAVVLLLIYWFDRLWPLLPPGFGGGDGTAVPQARGPGEGSGAGGNEQRPDGNAPQPLPDPAPDQPPEAPPDQKPPDPPPPLLELPEDRSFVPPAFVGDGVTGSAGAQSQRVAGPSAAVAAAQTKSSAMALRTERVRFGMARSIAKVAIFQPCS